VAFAASGAARRHKGMPKRAGRLAALAGPGIRTGLVTAAAFALTFGTLDVAFPAFACEHGSAAVAEVLLAALAAGGALGGFAYGLRRNPGPATRQYAALCLLAAAGLAPLIAGTGPAGHRRAGGAVVASPFKAGSGGSGERRRRRREGPREWRIVGAI